MVRPAQRKLKKLRKRGHVATPRLVIPDKIMQPGDTEWMPGIPAFHTGTDGGFHHFQIPGDSGFTPPDLGPSSIRDYAGAKAQQLVLWAINGDTQADEVLRATYGIDINAPTSGTGGGGTSFANQLDVLQAQQDFSALQNELDRAIDQQRADDALAISTGNRLSAEKIEANRLALETVQLEYTRSRDNLDRIIAQQGVNQQTRQQDIGQRDTDIAAGLQASGQRLSGLTSSGQQLGSLAALEQAANADKISLAANPRDFMELQFALGNGQNFLEQLAAGGTPGGQSAITGIDPLGASRGSLADLISQINQKPVFDQAVSTAGSLGDFQTPSLPGQVPGPGPESVLSPDQQVIFRQFMAAAAAQGIEVPIDVAISIARNPSASRQFLGAVDGGTGGTDTGGTDTGGGVIAPPGGLPAYADLPQFISGIQSRAPNLTQQDVTTAVGYQQLFSQGTGNQLLATLFGEIARIGQNVLMGAMTPDAAFGAYIRAWEPYVSATSGTGTTAGATTAGAATAGAEIGSTQSSPTSGNVSANVTQNINSGLLELLSGTGRSGPDNPLFGAATRTQSLIPGYLEWEAGGRTGPPPAGVQVSSTGSLSYDPNIQAGLFQNNQTLLRDITGAPTYFDSLPQEQLNDFYSHFQGVTIPGHPTNPAFNNQPSFPTGIPDISSPDYNTFRDQFINANPFLPPPPEAPAPGTATTSTLIGSGVPRTLSFGERSNLSKFNAASGSVTDRAKAAGIIPSLAGGGDLLVDEPSAIIGLKSGKTFATLGEPTREFPQGIPELIAPEGNGISITPPGKGNFAQRLRNLVSVPQLHKGGNIKLDTGFDDGPEEAAVVPPPLAIQLPPPTTVPAPAGTTPFDPAGQATPTPDFDPGALLRNLLSQRPDSYYGLSSDQTDQLFSVTSSLGIPRRTAQFLIERSFPRGVDPGQITTAGFSTGGYIRVA